jgi:cytochrome b6-f complex iron-sulfur subunit
MAISGVRAGPRAYDWAAGRSTHHHLNCDVVCVIRPRQPPNRRSLPAMSRLDDVCANRRAIIAALPGLILLPGAIAACSSSASRPTAAQASGQPAQSQASALSSVQVQQSQVPVGRAIIVSGPPPYVVAQPAQGQFVAFSAACTHRGATVTAGNGTMLDCPAHGSQFDAATGAVLSGPASQPLASVPVTAANGLLTIG